MTEQSNRGKLDSAKGFANEQRLLAALMSRGYSASKVDLPHSSYDIIVELKGKGKGKDLIRIQVKTVSNKSRVSFEGGSRGGADRKYKSGVKTYVQDTSRSDIVIGVDCIPNNGDTHINFFLIPTIFVEWLGQKSISINKIPWAKNKWDLLKECKDKRILRRNDVKKSKTKSRGAAKTKAASAKPRAKKVKAKTEEK